MEKLSDEQLREIREGCEGVTPGPWHHYHDHLRPGMAGYINEVQSNVRRKPIVSWSGFDANNRKDRGNARNASYIARLDPQTVSALIDELLALREASQWQPIETAPKDASRLLLAAASNDLFTGFWAEDEWLNDAGYSRKPHHWRPLLAPPESPK